MKRAGSRRVKIPNPSGMNPTEAELITERLSPAARAFVSQDWTPLCYNHDFEGRRCDHPASDHKNGRGACSRCKCKRWKR